MTLVPRVWISRTLKCKSCDYPLLMYEYGDWGLCRKCNTIFNMFLNKPKDTDHYQGEEAISQ